MGRGNEQMKAQIEKIVPFFAVDQGLALYPRILLNYFQEAAGIHSQMAQEDTLALMEKGEAWVLSRIGISVCRWPVLGDELKITTWHTGDKGFKAFRDFEVRCGQEHLVSAKSMWLYIDLHNKKILRIPKATSAAYTCEPPLEPDSDMDLDMDRWNPDTRFTPEQIHTIGLRPSDFDPLGHVNNALYFDFLETLMAQALPASVKPARIKLQYLKEIPMGTEAVDMALAPDREGYRFKFTSEKSVHAAGTFNLYSGLLNGRGHKTPDEIRHP